MENEERWLPVVGYEGFYEVSNTGRVRSIERTVIGARGICTRTAESKEKKLYVAKTGYPVANLYRDNKYKQIPVHRLVAEAFMPNPNNYPVINHMDGNKQNNHISNLEWCTYHHNSRHACMTGLSKYCKAVRNTNTGEIYYSATEASRVTGMSQTGICKQARGKTKKREWEYV